MAALSPRSRKLTWNPVEYWALLDEYYVTCHNQALVDGAGEPRSAVVSQLRAAGLTLDTLDVTHIEGAAPHWEQEVRKLRAGLMPQAGRARVRMMPRRTRRMDGVELRLDQRCNPDAS